MKVTDLQIGDLIMFEGYPFKVSNLNSKIHDDNFPIEIDRPADGYNVTFLFEDDVEPIPFEERMLHPNGFKRTKELFVFADDFFDLEIILVSDSIWMVSYHNCEINFPDERMMFSYVHELQHFLKHCKIEKEIIL